MRRALRALAIAALLVGLVAAASGPGLLRVIGEAGGADMRPGPLAILHAAAGHLAVLLACLAAAMAFVLGLQGLLEAGGRKPSSALLFLLGPAVMSLALAAEFSGRVNPDAVAAGFLAAELDAIRTQHALVVAPALGLGLLATAAVAGWLLRGTSAR